MSCTLRPCSKMNEGEDIGNRFPRSRVCASEKSRFRPRQDCYHESVSRGLVDRSLWTRQDSRSGFSRTNLHNPTATMSDADDDWTLLPDKDVPNTNNNDVSPLTIAVVFGTVMFIGMGARRIDHRCTNRPKAHSMLMRN